MCVIVTRFIFTVQKCDQKPDAPHANSPKGGATFKSLNAVLWKTRFREKLGLNPHIALGGNGGSGAISV